MNYTIEAGECLCECSKTLSDYYIGDFIEARPDEFLLLLFVIAIIYFIVSFAVGVLFK